MHFCICLFFWNCELVLIIFHKTNFLLDLLSKSLDEWCTLQKHPFTNLLLSYLERSKCLKKNRLFLEFFWFFILFLCLLTNLSNPSKNIPSIISCSYFLHSKKWPQAISTLFATYADSTLWMLYLWQWELIN